MSDLSPTLQRAKALFSAGRRDEALALAQSALRKSPGDAQAHNAMAIVLSSMGRHDEALYHSSRAAEAHPSDPQLALNLGIHLVAASRRGEALAPILRAYELAPTSTQAQQALGDLLRTREAFGVALEQLAAAIARRPKDATLAGLYAGTLTNSARVADAAAFLRDWLSRGSDLRLALVYANTLTYCPGVSPAESFEAHRRFAQIVAEQMPKGEPVHTNDPDPDRVIRVGVLSNEFRRHAVATFIEPWIANHDRGSQELVCYSVSSRADETTARFRAAVPSWVDASSLTSPQLMDRIRADRIDVLIETTGLNQGHRMGTLWMKPAPVQATLIGYLNTTGLSRIDYRIVDAHTDPPGAEAYSAEKLVRLDPTYLCYRPPDDAPDVRPRDDGPITFGSFNSTAKLNDPVVRLWCRILDAVPGSRLLLKSFDFADPVLRQTTLAWFTRHGADSARIQIDGPTSGVREFYATYHPVDIALDTFPFNGTTTTIDALFMGVPAVALAGSMHAGRTGVSILSTLGLTDLLAADESRYLSIAAALAADPARLASLRGSLRPRLLASPLCDAPAFARRMDQALRTMWRTWCSGR